MQILYFRYKSVLQLNEKCREELISAVINAGYHLHKHVGPVLLESVYEAVLAGRLEQLGYKVVRQMPVRIIIDGISFADAYRVDLFVNDWLVVELKALEKLSGVHVRQTRTYIKFLKQPIGLVLNFGSEFFKDGIRRVYCNN